jgi:hypothetical protein
MGFLILSLIYFKSVNLVVVKRLGIAGVGFSMCSGEKGGVVLFVSNGFVTEVGFQLFISWYVLFMRRGR